MPERRAVSEAWLAGLSFAAVRELVKANWAEYYTHLGRTPVAELTVGPHLSWLLTGIPDSFLNAVFRVDIPPDRVADVVDETLAQFREKHVTRLSWWADVPDGDVGRQLLRRDLTFDRGGTAMAADLGSLPDQIDLPPGLVITPLVRRDDLEAWVHLACVGFGIPEWAERRVMELFAPVALEPPMHSYLAVLDGQPVATSQLFIGAGVAGIYNVTTSPEARGRGMGRAVTHAALAEARRQGYGVSILQASDLGHPVYRRLGFRDFGRLGAYVWSEPSA